jgi:hypothetical protein
MKSKPLKFGRSLLVAVAALSGAAAKGWTVVSIKNDWKRIYPVAGK